MSPETLLKAAGASAFIVVVAGYLGWTILTGLKTGEIGNLFSGTISRQKDPGQFFATLAFYGLMVLLSAAALICVALDPGIVNSTG